MIGKSLLVEGSWRKFRTLLVVIRRRRRKARRQLVCSAMVSSNIRRKNKRQNTDFIDYQIHKKLRLEEEGVVVGCSIQVPRWGAGGQQGEILGLSSWEHHPGPDEYCPLDHISETSEELEHGVCQFWGYRGGAADCNYNM